VRDRDAQRVTEECGDGKPVRERTDHRCLSDGTDVADPGALVFVDFGDEEHDGREDEQERRHRLHFAERLCFAGIFGRQRVGLRCGCGSWAWCGVGHDRRRQIHALTVPITCVALVDGPVWANSELRSPCTSSRTDRVSFARHPKVLGNVVQFSSWIWSTYKSGCRMLRIDKGAERGVDGFVRW